MPEGSAAEKIEPENIEKAPEKAKGPDVIENEWAEKYWESVRSREPDPKIAKEYEAYTKDTIAKEIEELAKGGKLEITSLGKELTDEDRAKLFAYKQVAKERGYKVGPYEQSKDGASVSAKLSREKGEVISLDKYRRLVSGGGEKIKNAFSGEGIGLAKAKEALSGFFGKQAEQFKEKYKGFNFSPKDALSRIEAKKIFGKESIKFWAGFASGSGVRYLAKLGIGASMGFWAAPVAGALGGGAAEFVKTAYSEYKRVKNITEEEIIKLAREKIDRGEAGENANELLANYLSMKDQEETFAEFGSQRQAFAERLKKEFKENSINWGKVKNGVIKGAAYGALGGTLGGIVADWFSATPEMKEAAKIAQEAGLGGEARAQMQELISETYSNTHEAALAEEISGLNGKTFGALADIGDGYEKMAGKGLHDLIAQLKKLGIEVDLDESQIVYARNLAGKTMEAINDGKTIHPGDFVGMSIENYESVIEKAKILSDAGIQNLKKEWVPKISDWGKIKDYSFLYNDANNYSDEILKNASEEAARAVEDAKESIATELAYQDAISEILEPAEKKALEEAGNYWFEKTFSLLGSIAAAYISEKSEIKGRNKKRAEAETTKEYRHIEDFNDGEPDLRPEPKEIIDLKEEDVLQGSEERTGKEKPIDLDNYEFVKEFPGEGSEKKPETKLELNPEKIERSLSTDPLYKYLKKHKFDVLPGSVYYWVIDRSNGKEEFKRINSYKELRDWFKGLPKSERVWIREREKNKSAIFLHLPPKFKEYLKINKEISDNFEFETNKIINKLLGNNNGDKSKKYPANIDEYNSDNSDWTDQMFRDRIAQENNERNLNNLARSLGEKEAEKKENNNQEQKNAA